MSADGVREAAARAVAERLGFTYPGSDAGWVFDAAADAALAAIADHPGLAEVLRRHEYWRVEWDEGEPGIPQCDECWGVVDLNADSVTHLADVVRAWLRGETA